MAQGIRVPFRFAAFFADRLRVEGSNEMISEFAGKAVNGSLLSGIRNGLQEGKAGMFGDQSNPPLWPDRNTGELCWGSG